MPRRRPVTRTREPKNTPYVRRHLMEELERRRMLYTTVPSGTDTFEYKDASDQIVRIAYHNVQAEFVFARVNPDTNELVLSEPTLSFQEEDGKDLFAIYVAQAGEGSYITAAQVPAITTFPRPMQPFTGNVSLTIVGSAGIQPVTTASGSGAIYLGAKTRDTPANIANEPDRPFLTDQFFGMGILGPRPNGRLTAGLVTEKGVDLGKFFWGGAISGQVSLGGSVDTFYAGALLTGDTRGESGFVTIPNNFSVAGDIRELIVMGSIGTHDNANNGDPIYQTGFDMEVRGTIGRIQNYNHIIGNIRAINDPAAPRLRYNQHEVENKVLPGNRGSATHFQGTDQRDLDFDQRPEVPQPRLGDNAAVFDNDTFETAQFLGSFNSAEFGAGSVVVNGRLQFVPQIVETVDYYAIPLMAGQSIDVRLLAPFDNPFADFEDVAAASLSVFDPDGRLVASDSNNVIGQATLNKLFRFTADRPGAYRFAVNIATNLLDNYDYQLQVTNVGTMSIGAVHSTGEIFGEAAVEHQFAAMNGDLGAVFAGGAIGNAGFSGTFVDGGNLRVLDVAQIGFNDVDDNRFAPNIEAFGGDVGVIRARTGFANIFSLVAHDNRRGIGGSVQLIDVPNGTLRMRLNADKMLGVVRAADMATARPSVINVNADQRGADGIIDLIDVTGNFGRLGPGGPQITTGPGGNVRYIHVGGTTFRDIFFGGGAPDIVDYSPGESVTFTDDSGTQMILRPNPSRTFDPITGFPTAAGSLRVTRYGIRDKGGNVLVNLESTRGVEIFAGGQQGGRGAAEIGEINANGLGTLIVDDRGNLFNTGADDRLRLANTGDDLEILIDGAAVIDVYEIVGGNFTEIGNGTAGEIVNVTAQSIGRIEAATLGLAKSHTGTLVGGNTILNTTPTEVPVDSDVFEGELGPDAGPFNGQRIGIVVGAANAGGGDIVTVRARQGLGNIIVDGSIQELYANADGRNTPGVHEGINAPIMTRTGGVATGGGGEIRWVQIGEGILPSGTGSVSFSGIFAHSRIGTIVNQGEGSDIRGDVHSKAENLPTERRLRNDGVFETRSLAPIGVIDLDDGAIIGADIMVTTRFQNSWEIGGGQIFTPNIDLFTTDPAPEIGIVSLEGKGGIMSAQFLAHGIGDIEVKNGFGIFTSTFRTVAEGAVGNITVDGYGVRSTVFRGGGDLASITARGSGARLSAMNYSSSVRFSEQFIFDPFSGFQLSEINDLHLHLGTSARAPVRLTTDFGRGGVIDDVDARGSGTLGNVSAHQIKSSRFAFAAATNSVVARDYIDTLTITSGRLNFLQTTQDVHRAEWHIAGPVGTVRIGGTWRGTSFLGAEGPNGHIGTFATGRAMYGTVLSSNDIGEIAVAWEIGSTGLVFLDDGERFSAGIDVGGSLHLLRVGRDIIDGATIWVDDRLGSVIIDGDVEEEARIDVEELGSIRVGGSIFGDFIIRSET